MNTHPTPWRRVALALAACATLGACATTENDTMAGSSQTESLGEQLDAYREGFNQRADDETKRAYDTGVRLVDEMNLDATAIGVGDTAPDFSLPDATGGTTTLSELLKEGPVILVWYRGGWCPYCNIQLHSYQGHLAEIKGLGGRLVAISPETPDNSLSTKEKNELEFHVVSDEGNRVARDYGVVYRLPGIVQSKFEGRLDIPAYNGDDSWTLPLAATYVIDTDRTVRYAFLSADYRERAEPTEVIDVLRDLD